MNLSLEDIKIHYPKVKNNSIISKITDQDGNRFLLELNNVRIIDVENILNKIHLICSEDINEMFQDIEQKIQDLFLEYIDGDKNIECIPLVKMLDKQSIIRLRLHKPIDLNDWNINNNSLINIKIELHSISQNNEFMQILWVAKSFEIISEMDQRDLHKQKEDMIQRVKEVQEKLNNYVNEGNILIDEILNTDDINNDVIVTKLNHFENNVLYC